MTDPRAADAGPEVTPLDPADAGVAAEIHAVMQAAYRVEAALLGVADFVPLARTVAQVACAPCVFAGVREDGRLVAAIEIDPDGAERPNVDALVVHPDAFRRGLGTALLWHAIGAWGARGLTVSTGERNAPALALYARHGFALERRWRTDDGIPMVTLARPARV